MYLGLDFVSTWDNEQNAESKVRFKQEVRSDTMKPVHTGNRIRGKRAITTGVDGKFALETLQSQKLTEYWSGHIWSAGENLKNVLIVRFKSEKQPVWSQQATLLGSRLETPQWRPKLSLSTGCSLREWSRSFEWLLRVNNYWLAVDRHQASSSAPIWLLKSSRYSWNIFTYCPIVVGPLGDIQRIFLERDILQFKICKIEFCKIHIAKHRNGQLLDSSKFS